MWEAGAITRFIGQDFELPAKGRILDEAVSPAKCIVETFQKFGVIEDD
jgi:hypothetical protein